MTIQSPVKMINYLIGIGLSLISFFALSADNAINGAGSSLSNAVMQKLIAEYGPSHRIEITYKSVGSGEGIRRIAASTLDFALTDVPLTKYELDLLGLIQFPLFFSAITPVINVPGVDSGSLKLSGNLIADIFLGRITKWDDAKIAEFNKDLHLPNIDIKVITRADTSGSSYVFTGYLSQESTEWGNKLGVGSKLNWPVGQSVIGTEAVVKTVKSTPGAIGYVEYGDALRNNASLVQLKIGDNFFAANYEFVKQNSISYKWNNSSYYPLRFDNQTVQIWPMVAVTYSLIRRVCSDEEDARDTLLFMDWILEHKNPIYQDLNIINAQNSALISSVRRKLTEVVNSKGNVILNFESIRAHY
jgi:phosphate transport system substrate-binding protein